MMNQIERYLLNEVPDDERRVMEQNPETSRQIRALALSNQEILASYPPEVFVPKILKRHAEIKGRKRLRRYKGVPTVLVAAVLIACFPFFLSDPMPQAAKISITQERPVSTIRTKGIVPTLHIYLRKGESVEALSSGARIEKGDRVQIAYSVGNEKYGVIFSIDGNDLLTLHYPLSSSKSAPLIGGKEVVLPNSFEVDDAPKFENFYILTSDDPFNLHEVLPEVHQKKKIEVLQQKLRSQLGPIGPSKLRLTSLEIQKNS